jgi:hypothetical protein
VEDGLVHRRLSFLHYAAGCRKVQQ